METITLKVDARQKTEKSAVLRRNNEIPCVVYGNTENTMVKCKEQELKRAYLKAGASTVVELDLNGKNVPVLFHETDLDPVSDRFMHVDFYALDMKKEVTTHVHVQAVGESPAVKGLGGILVAVTSEVTVKCLPKDLPHGFDISLEKLAQFGDTVTVADIGTPHGVTILTDAATILFTVQEARQLEPETVAAPAEGEAAGTDAAAAPAPEGDAAAAGKKEEK